MFKIQFTLILFLAFTFFVSQVNFTKSSNVTAKSYHQNLSVSTNFNVKVFYQKQCGFCHTQEELIGPDMNKIKGAYLKKYPKKEDFIKAVSAFVSNPDKKSAIYKDGINNFMDMPKMPFKTDEIKAVSAYIYDTESFK